MQKAKMVDLLKCLDFDAFRRLRKALESPYFTSNSHLLNLYQYLKKYYPDFVSPRLKKEIVFEKIFPGHLYSDSKMRNLMSAFSTLVEDFIVLEKSKENHYQRSKILLDFYQTRNEEWYRKTLDQLTNQLNQSPIRDPDYFLEAFQLSLRYTEWNAEHSQIEEYFFQKEEAKLMLDNYYGLFQVQLQLAHKASPISNKEIQKERPLSRFDDKPLEANLLYQLHQTLDQILEDGETKEVPLFLEALRKNEANIKPTTRRELFVVLLNFCISQMHSGEKTFLPLVFDLYQFGLSEKILLENQRISNTTFLNIIIIGGRLGEIDWTETFRNQYADFLSTDERPDVLILGKAYLYFYTRQFSKCLHTLLHYTFKNPLQLYPARTFILRCHLELYLSNSSYLDALLAQCAAFEKYVRRNDLFSEKWKASALSFEKMIRKMVNIGLSHPLNEKAREKLREELISIPLIESRRWLLEKLN